MTRWHKSPAVLQAAREWRDRCLFDDGSILSDHQLWTLENIAFLERHFVQNLDTGEGNFLGKLAAQLEPAPAPAKQLAAEMLWILYLSVSETAMRGATKLVQIRQVWEWSGDPLPDSPMLGEVLETGVANPGTGFATNRWRELVFCIELTRDFKRLPSEERARLGGDAWAFSRWLDSLPAARRQFRHMLLYLLFPEHFERIVTSSHKVQILETFRPQLGLAGTINFNDRTEVDRALHELRPLLEERYGAEITDYYLPPLKDAWLTKPEAPPRPPAGPAPTPVSNDAGDPDRFVGRRVWLISAGEGARLWPEFQRDGIAAIGWDYLGDLSSYPTYEAVYEAIRTQEGGNPTNNARACWQFGRDVKPGDFVVAKQGRTTLLGYGTVTTEYRSDPSRSEYQNVYGVQWQRTGLWTLPDEHSMVVKTFTDMTPYAGWLRAAFGVMDGVPVAGGETPIVDGSEREAEPEVYTKDDALEDLFLAPEQLTAILDALGRKKNVILEGAPGVGKTFVARRIAWALMGRKDNRRVEMVQFHQSYAYEDFIQGWRPTATGGFQRQDGVFHRFCARARHHPLNAYVFIIDELNRGNLSKVFGELMMLIEPDKRGPEFAIPLTYSPDERFDVPENLYILGMMNTADRSLAMVDYALRRRFSFVRLEPAFGSDRFVNHLMAEGVDESLAKRIAARMGELNRQITEDTRNLGPGFEIGHSFFVPAKGQEGRDEAWYQRVVRHEIEPLLHEYWFDQPDAVRDHVGRLLA
jgi:hypothetical protein